MRHSDLPVRGLLIGKSYFMKFDDLHGKPLEKRSVRLRLTRRCRTQRSQRTQGTHRKTKDHPMSESLHCNTGGSARVARIFRGRADYSLGRPRADCGGRAASAGWTSLNYPSLLTQTTPLPSARSTRSGHCGAIAPTFRSFDPRIDLLLGGKNRFDGLFGRQVVANGEQRQVSVGKIAFVTVAFAVPFSPILRQAVRTKALKAAFIVGF